MIFHENRLLADDSHEISCFFVIFEKAANFEIAICCKEALAIRRIFSLDDMIAKAQFSNCPYDFKKCLFG